MARETLKIDMETFSHWAAQGVLTILQDIEDERNTFMEDYFTASDLQDYIRWRADIEAGAISYEDRSPYGGWWGYRGMTWTRLSIPDKPPRTDLLSLCRSELRDHIGLLEAHNLKKGHCSGMRFRRKGTGLSEAEKKTLANKDREKPVHAIQEGTKLFQHKLLCRVDRKTSKGRSYSRPRRSNVRVTKDESKVTCKSCLKKLREAANQ